VLVVGVVLLAIGTFITPFMTSTLGLILAIGVLAAGGSGMAGPAVLMSASVRMIDPAGAAWPPASSTRAARSGSSQPRRSRPR
jgi:hypothetical protein